MTAIDILTLLLVTLVWGFNFAVVKIGLAQLPPILFVSLRFFLVAALLLYEHLIVSPKDMRRLNAAFFTMNGVISVVFFVFVATALLLKH